MLYSFHRFKALPAEIKIDQLSQHGIALDLAYTVKSAEAVLFAYNGFYIELILEKCSDEILAIHCFKNSGRLNPYLHQIDISEITALLSCNSG